MKARDKQRIIVIGDIHGCARTFTRLLDDKIGPGKDDQVYLLGDYIDRGPRSRQVIDVILDMQASGLNVYPIMGNHEFMLLQTCLYPIDLPLWMKNGARQTLDSFGVDSPNDMDSKYLDFFRSLAYYYLLPEYVIVHGGLNFDIDNPFDDREAMVWERNKEVLPEKIGGRKLIVGHTPRTLDQVKKSLRTNKIMLDGGCVYYKVHEDMGYLCALELNSMKLFTQVNID